MPIKTASPAKHAALMERFGVPTEKTPGKPRSHRAKRVARAKTPKPPSALELAFMSLVEQENWPRPETEHRFHESRKWRLDFYWPGLGPTRGGVAVETEGGTFSGGRHTRGVGFEGDCEKYGEAALAGICVIRVTRGMLENGMARRLVARALGAEDGACSRFAACHVPRVEVTVEAKA